MSVFFMLFICIMLGIFIFEVTHIAGYEIRRLIFNRKEQ